MALSWDPDGARQLVAQLSPPWPADEVERALYRIYRGFAPELYRERQESQKNDQVRQELEALQKALRGLSGRTRNLLCEALDEPLFPPHAFDLAINTIHRASNSILDDMPTELRPGRKGVVSAATYKAIHILCLVYCRVHDKPYPTWDFYAETTRDREALDFALACLQEWYTPGIEGLTADELTRGLHHYRRKNSR